MDFGFRVTSTDQGAGADVLLPSTDLPLKGNLRQHKKDGSLWRTLANKKVSCSELLVLRVDYSAPCATRNHTKSSDPVTAKGLICLSNN